MGGASHRTACCGEARGRFRPWALLPGTAGPGRYRDGVAVQPVMTAEELFERMRHASPPSGDDVPVTFDGRRLDSADAVRAWLADLAARRAAADADDGG